jgi:lipoate-protein ligase A
MRLLDFSADSPELNLALDEALLLTAEEETAGETLRFWSSDRPFVVLGYSRAVGDDVDIAACRRDGVPVLRRHTGGGTVLQGPGCLNYNLVLRMDRGDQFSTITGSTRAILERHAAALAPLLHGDVLLEGESDLTFGGRKFSGNAQRRLGSCLEFHGTMLLGFDVASLTRYLRMPARQPAYRRKREHRDFVANIPLEQQEVKDTLAAVWGAGETLTAPPLELARRLVNERYARPEWTMRVHERHAPQHPRDGGSP